MLFEDKSVSDAGITIFTIFLPSTDSGMTVVSF